MFIRGFRGRLSPSIQIIIASHYLLKHNKDELQLNRAIKAPRQFRDSSNPDTHPSFGIYQDYYDNVRFKDFSTTNKGDVIEFVRQIERLQTREEAHALIYNELDFNSISDYSFTIHPKNLFVSYEPYLDFTTTALRFWSKWNINKETLSKFNVYENKKYMIGNHTFETIGYLSFSYLFNDCIKIYNPFSEYKWSGNVTHKTVEGYYQHINVRRNNFCVITKALKEVMFYDSIGIEAYSSPSESSMLYEPILEELCEKYDYIVLIVDSDKQGFNLGYQYLKKLSAKKLRVHYMSDKNITDMIERTSIQEGIEYIKQITK